MPTKKDREKRQSIIDACRSMNACSASIRERREYQPAPWRGNAGDTDQHALRGDAARADRAHGHGRLARSRPAAVERMAISPRYPQGPARNQCGGPRPPDLLDDARHHGNLEIPPIHYMIACAGGDTSAARPMRLSARGTFGERRCALKDAGVPFEHHGMIAVGTSLWKAMWLAVEVETLARQYHGCLQIGTPRLLPKAEIENVLGRIAGYGPADK